MKRALRRPALEPMRTWPGRIGSVLRPALVDKVDRDHRQSDASSCAAGSSSAITLVVGATLLGFSLNVPTRRARRSTR